MLARFNRVSICPSHAGIVRYALTYRAGFDTGKLEGKYSLESTDPRESEIRAPPQLTIALMLSYYLFIIAKLFKVKDGCLKFVYVGKKSPVYGVFGQ